MINLDDLPMRVGLGQFQQITTSRLRFIKQCGCDDFQLNAPVLPGEERWEYEDLAHLARQATEAQLRLVAIENVPVKFYDRIMLGEAGRRAGRCCCPGLTRVPIWVKCRSRIVRGRPSPSFA